MSLRQQAERDLAATLEAPGDFGWPIALSAPDGTTHDFTGSSSDIALTIDPETGGFVTGRRASVMLRIASLLAVFDSLPVAIAQGTPWIATVRDITGAVGTFRIVDSMPDRTLGVVTLALESYVAATY